MKNFWVLTKRELLSVFVSPVAYGTAAVFLFIFGLVFVGQFTRTRLVDIRTLIDPLGHILPVLVAPVLTMRLLAEEKRLGTLEMLLTAPVGNAEVVLAKFAGVLLFYGAILSLTWCHLGVMLYFYKGGVDWGSILTGYLGMLLIAGLFLALGLCSSSLFESQILAALASFTGGMAILMIGALLSAPVFLKPGLSLDIFQFLLPFGHYQTFLHGVLDSRDLAYFLLTTAFFLFLSTKMLESRKWM